MVAQKNIGVYILCGGLSLRMGEEKGMVAFKGKPFVEHIINAIYPISPQIQLVTSNQVYRRFGFPLVKDIYENKGPVGGIYTALKHSKFEWNIILSCDIPNIRTAVLRHYLLNLNTAADIVFLKDDKRDYPLIGLYRKTVLPTFRKALLQDELKLMQTIFATNFHAIQVKAEDQVCLSNVNTKEDLEYLTKSIC